LVVPPAVEQAADEIDQIYCRYRLGIQILHVLEQSSLLVSVSVEESLDVVAVQHWFLLEEVFLERLQMRREFVLLALQGSQQIPHLLLALDVRLDHGLHRGEARFKRVLRKLHGALVAVLGDARVRKIRQLLALHKCLLVLVQALEVRAHVVLVLHRYKVANVIVRENVEVEEELVHVFCKGLLPLENDMVFHSFELLGGEFREVFSSFGDGLVHVVKFAEPLLDVPNHHLRLHVEGVLCVFLSRRIRNRKHDSGTLRRLKRALGDGA